MVEPFQFQLGRSTEIALSITLSMMMFAIALNLKTEAFKHITLQPKSYFVGVSTQLIGLPLISLGLCFLLTPPPTIALGMLVIACCPGGNVSNFLVHLARGNVALSVSMTITSSIVVALLLPFLLLFWTQLYPPTADLLQEIDFNRQQFIAQTSLILVLPLLLGMMTSYFIKDASVALSRCLVQLSSLALAVIVIATLLRYWSLIVDIASGVLLLVALHNACAFISGNLMARLSKMAIASRRAITIEIGIQNAGLALIVLLTQFDALGGAVIVVALWGIWHLIAGLMVVGLMRWQAQ